MFVHSHAHTPTYVTDTQVEELDQAHQKKEESLTTLIEEVEEVRHQLEDEKEGREADREASQEERQKMEEDREKDSQAWVEKMEALEAELEETKTALMRQEISRKESEDGQLDKALREVGRSIM